MNPTPVLVGTAVGAAAALASILAWPRASFEPAVARRASTRRQIEPSPTGAGLTIVFNEASGTSTHRREIEAIQRELPDAEIVAVDPTRDFADAAAEAARRCRAIGALGGDGTISAVATAAMDAGVPLVVFPGGTLNHFARDVGVGDVDEAVAAVRSGGLIEIDVGMIAGRPFLNTASFGVYSEFVEAREKYQSRIGKWPAVMIALWTTVLSCAPTGVTIDGVHRRIWMIFIGNCSYDPPGFAPASRRRLDDGRFDVRIVDGTRPGARVRLILAVLTGRVGRSVVYTRELVDRLDVETEASVPVLAADGEIFSGESSFTIEKRRARLAVFVPQ